MLGDVWGCLGMFEDVCQTRGCWLGTWNGYLDESGSRGAKRVVAPQCVLARCKRIY